MRIRTRTDDGREVTYRAEDVMEALYEAATSPDHFNQLLRSEFVGWGEEWYMDRCWEFCEQWGLDEPAQE